MARWRGRARLLVGVCALAALLAACGNEAEPAGSAAGADEVPGRWRKLRPARVDPALRPEQRAEIARLEAIGYVAGSTPAGDRRGVSIHDRARAYAGLNLYTSGHAPEAVLMDMDGRVLHRWRHAFRDVWSDFPKEWVNAGAGFFRRAHLYPNGDLLAIYEGLGLVKLDRDSRLVWASPIQAHHDLEVAPDGDIYVLGREARVVPEVDPEHPVLIDFVVQLAPDGSERRRVSILDALRRSPWARLFDPARTRMGDVFHTNSISVLDGRLADRWPAFRRGSALVSMLVPNALAVVDLERGGVGWALEGSFRSQHDPKLLPDGRILLFDNRGLDPWKSRVIEVDPSSGEIAWSWAGTPERPFFSLSCGAVERLPNGDTLVSESDAGRAFELAPDGTIVWEYYNPHRSGERDELIATLFEMVRLPPDFPTGWATGPGGSGRPASRRRGALRVLRAAPGAGSRARARSGADRAGRPRATPRSRRDAPGRTRSRGGRAPGPPRSRWRSGGGRGAACSASRGACARARPRTRRARARPRPGGRARPAPPPTPRGCGSSSRRARSCRSRAARRGARAASRRAGRAGARARAARRRSAGGRCARRRPSGGSSGPRCRSGCSRRRSGPGRSAGRGAPAGPPRSARSSRRARSSAPRSGHPGARPRARLRDGTRSSPAPSRRIPSRSSRRRRRCGRRPRASRGCARGRGSPRCWSRRAHRRRARARPAAPSRRGRRASAGRATPAGRYGARRRRAARGGAPRPRRPRGRRRGSPRRAPPRASRGAGAASRAAPPAGAREARGGLGVVAAPRGLERRRAVDRARGGIGAAREQELDDAGVPGLRREVERRRRVHVARVDRRAARDELGRDLLLAEDRGEVERRHPLVVRRVGTGPAREERRDQLEPAPHDGARERRPAVAVAGLEAGAGVEEQRGDRGAPAPPGGVQSGLARGVPGVRVGPAREQQRDDRLRRRLAAARGDEERRLVARAPRVGRSAELEERPRGVGLRARGRDVE